MNYYFDLIDKYKAINTHCIDFTITSGYIDVTVTNNSTKKVLKKQFSLSIEDSTFEQTLKGI